MVYLIYQGKVVRYLDEFDAAKEGRKLYAESGEWPTFMSPDDVIDLLQLSKDDKDKVLKLIHTIESAEFSSDFKKNREELLYAESRMKREIDRMRWQRYVLLGTVVLNIMTVINLLVR